MHLFRLRISSLTPAPKPTQYTLLLIQSEAKQTVIFHLTPQITAQLSLHPFQLTSAREKANILYI